MGTAAIELSALDEDTPPGERLAESQTVLDLVSAFHESAADIRRAFALLGEAEARLDRAFLNDGTTDKVTLTDRQGRSLYWDMVTAEDAIKRLRLEVWGHLVDVLEVRRFLSVKRAHELNDMLQDKGPEKLPDVTIENVLAFARGLRSQVHDMLTEAVQEVFEWLRPRGHTVTGKLKTNTELEVGRKAIIGYAVEYGWLGRNAKQESEHGYRVDYHRNQNIRALENVFTALDGKGAVTKTYEGQLSDAIRASGEKGTGETDYFRFKCFRNRNLHLEFKRLDLLKNFNAIAGGKRLRPGATSES